MDKYKITKKGFDDLSEELKELVAKRTAIVDKIKSARELGDLSENAEYAAARAEQGRNEGRIQEIEDIIKKAAIIKVGKKGVVSLGDAILVKHSNGSQQELMVVGTVESDPLEGKISDESPLGKALLGRKIGEEVDWETPGGTKTISILKIG